MKRNERLLIALWLVSGVFGVAEFESWVGAAAAPPQSERRLPALFIIGDSTVNNSTKGLQGWGARQTIMASGRRRPPKRRAHASLT